MAIFYSATAHGFFDDAIHASLPADAVPISMARHHELLALQASGARIEASENGKPRTGRIVHNAKARRTALARRVKREAERRINAIAPLWRQINDMRTPTPESAARFAMIDAIRTAAEAIEADLATARLTDLDLFDITGHAACPTE